MNNTDIIDYFDLTSKKLLKYDSLGLLDKLNKGLYSLGSKLQSVETVLSVKPLKSNSGDVLIFNGTDWVYDKLDTIDSVLISEEDLKL